MMNLVINRLVYTTKWHIHNLWMLSTIQTILSRETSRATYLNSKWLQGQQQWVVQQLLFCSQIAPEAISEGQKSENFLGEYAPRPLTTGTLLALLCFLWITLEPPHFKILDPPLLRRLGIIRSSAQSVSRGCIWRLCPWSLYKVATFFMPSVLCQYGWHEHTFCLATYCWNTVLKA